MKKDEAICKLIALKPHVGSSNINPRTNITALRWFCCAIPFYLGTLSMFTFFMLSCRFLNTSDGNENVHPKINNPMCVQHKINYILMMIMTLQKCPIVCHGKKRGLKNKILRDSLTGNLFIYLKLSLPLVHKITFTNKFQLYHKIKYNIYYISLHIKHPQSISPIFFILFLNSNNESLEFMREPRKWIASVP